MSIRSVLAIFGLSVLICWIVACDGSNENPPHPTRSAEEILAEKLADLEPYTPIQLDTAAVAKEVEAGEQVWLPFVSVAHGLVTVKVTLKLRNLRHENLTTFLLKDDLSKSWEEIPLPPPQTYQGMVLPNAAVQTGVAILTVTDSVVEGCLLVVADQPPDVPPQEYGWSFIEPLEPLLRMYGVSGDDRKIVLAKFNHMVYNIKDSGRCTRWSPSATTSSYFG